MHIYSKIIHDVTVVEFWALGAGICSAASSPDLQAARITAFFSPLILADAITLPPMPADRCHVVKSPSGGSCCASLAASEPGAILHFKSGWKGVRNKCFSTF